MFRPNLEPSSVVDQKVHGMVTYTYTDGGGGKRWEKTWAGRQVAVCVLQNQCGAETFGNFVTIDICPSIYSASEVLNPQSVRATVLSCLLPYSSLTSPLLHNGRG